MKYELTTPLRFQCSSVSWLEKETIERALKPLFEDPEGRMVELTMEALGVSMLDNWDNVYYYLHQQIEMMERAAWVGLRRKDVDGEEWSEGAHAIFAMRSALNDRNLSRRAKDAPTAATGAK